MDSTAHQAEMLSNRLRKNDRHLRKWAKRERVSCYRVYERDIPEIPLAVDRYGDHLYVAQYRTEHKQHTEADGWFAAMVEASLAALEVPPEMTHVRLRERKRDRDKVSDSGSRFKVEESGLRFWVNLDDYLDTGLFLDHRPLRARIRAEAEGRRFLNLFCYTGSFTVYAASGGARSSLSVDMSNTYLDWAADNLLLNGFVETNHELVRADVLDFLADPGPRAGKFDLAVLDPPTFSHGKKMEQILDTRRDHPELIARTLRFLRPGGTLYFSTNARKFTLDEIPDATVEEITEATTPPDFQKRAHRCWRITKH
jgi:23S rRNA G2069 N7-methylase RlmK/C1962 C5-methylase RlmI